MALIETLDLGKKHGQKYTLKGVNLKVEAGDVLAHGLLSEWKDLVTVVKMMELRMFTEHPKLLQTLINFRKVNPF